MKADIQIAQPGLFIVRRPLLTLLVLLGVLVLVGFNDGALLSGDIREKAFDQLSVLGMAVFAVCGFCLLPAISPAAAWPRAMLAFGIVIATIILVVFGQGGDGQSLADAQIGLIFFAGLATAALLLLRPITGRAYPLAALLAIPFTLVGVLVMTAWVIRTGAGVTSSFFLLLSLSLAFSTMISLGFVARLVSLEVGQQIGTRLATALAFNNLIRDSILGVLALGLFFWLYPFLLPATNAPAGIGLPLAIMVFTCIPALAVIASAYALTGHSDWKISGWQGAQNKAQDLFKQVLKPAKPSVLTAGLAIACVVSLVLFIETPFMRWGYLAADSMIAGLSRFAVFYLLLFCLVASTYASLRMGVVVALTFLLTDSMAAGLMNVIASSADSAYLLLDVIPRFLLLMVLVSVTRQWADILHNRHIQRYQITKTFAGAVAPALLSTLCCLLLFLCIGLLSAEKASDMLYISQRFSVQVMLSFLILPCAMSVMAGLRAKF
ncbi:MAG: hypothetical protein MRY72_02750 [Aquisalinus sp.]|nr:hypothetical protein [Aquisalinus sp.]